MKASVDSADPHLLFTPNRNVLLHVYEPLIFQDRYSSHCGPRGELDSDRSHDMGIQAARRREIS